MSSCDSEKKEKGNSKQNRIIGLRIAELRKTMNLSLRKFAEHCGYSATQIGGVEKGELQPGVRLVERISRTCGVSEAWLRGEDEVLERVSMQTPGERVRQIYQDSGLGQRAFCEKIKSSPSNLRDIMEGRRPLSLSYARKIEEAYAVSVDWLMYGLEETKEYPCDEHMILFLKKNPDLRREIWNRMMIEEES